MKLLIIGGGVFLGEAAAAEAIARGHQVTAFNRGLSNPAVPSGVEHLKGDRDRDLGALGGRQWDAAIDTSGYFPRQVRGLLGAVGSSLGHYTFISSVSAYADLGRPGANESSSLAKLLDPAEGSVTETTYGPLKSACEEAALRAKTCPVLVVRPGIIIGPHDPTGRFAYWLMRVNRGGEVLAPGEPGAPLQLIDVRDLAGWLVTMAERRTIGVFNAVGKAPFTFGEMLSTCATVLRCQPEFTWVNDGFLARQGATEWSSLPFFVSETKPGFAGGFQVDGSAALGHGLRLRSFSETALDTFRWLREPGTRSPAQIGLSPDRERELLSTWHASPP